MPSFKRETNSACLSGSPSAVPASLSDVALSEVIAYDVTFCEIGLFVPLGDVSTKDVSSDFFVLFGDWSVLMFLALSISDFNFLSDDLFVFPPTPISGGVISF